MPDSATGFGGADWLEFFFAALLILSAFIWTPALQKSLASFAAKTRLAMLTLFLAPIALRLLLLPNHPVPTPNVYDEFSHLLVADTLLHLRLANPPHPMHRFFETFFILQQPTYGSIYPLGQGLILAFGRLISGVPWTGVLCATGALCALSYWMLRAYVPPLWALLGGILAIIEFGPLNLWMNCYWGGALPAAAGCLVFGALPRLLYACRRCVNWRKRDAALLGIGFGLHLVTRPFESALLAISIALFCLLIPFRNIVFRSALRSAFIALIAISPALLLTLLQNNQVTERWATLPEELSQFQYGVPTTFTIQKPAIPHVQLTPQQALEYKAQLLMHGPDTDTLSRFLLRLEYRVRNYRFFFLPPLYLASAAFIFTLRHKLDFWVAATLVVFALGTNFFPYLLVHYLAGVTCLFLLISVAGLRQIGRLRVGGIPAGVDIVRILVLLCGAEFLLWYSIHVFENHHAPLALLQYETWDAINHRDPQKRIAAAREIAAQPGRLLIFVHYSPQHIFQEEWVWNAADIDSSRVVFARDLGLKENKKLMRYYPERRVLWFEADTDPPRLSSGMPADQ